MPMNNLAQTYQRNSDEIKLGAYTVLMLITGLVVARVFDMAFGSFSPLERTFENILIFIPLIDKITIAAVLFGVYLGLIILLFFDYKKRVQSYLFGLGTLIAVAGFLANDILLSYMGPVDFVLTLLAGAVVFIRIGGQQLRDLSISPADVFNSRVFTTDSDEPVEFHAAADTLSSLLTLVILAALFEAHTQYAPLLTRSSGSVVPNLAAFSNFSAAGSEQVIAVNLLFSLVFVGSLRMFLSYEAPPNRVVFIGPRRSGKTHAVIGLYAQAQSAGLNPRDASQYLTVKEGELKRTQRWVDPNEDEVDHLGFRFTAEGLFPKDVIIDGLDYPGEYSHHIPDGLDMHEGGLQFADLSESDLPQQNGDDFEFGKDEPIGNRLEAIRNGLDEPHPEWEPLIENARNGLEQELKKTIERTRERRASSGNVATGGGNQSDRGIGDSGTQRGATGGISDDGNSNTPPDRVYFDLVTAVLPKVATSDTVCFLFDIEEQQKWSEGDTTTRVDVGYYQQIVDLAGKRHIPIATKTDRWGKEFEERNNHRPQDAYGTFRDYINNRLLDGPFAGQVSSFGSVPLPVFIETEERGGEERPRIPLELCGFERLLEKLGE